MFDPDAPRLVRAPEFPPGLDWIGAADAAPPTMAAMRGRPVLVDLWTYG